VYLTIPVSWAVPVAVPTGNLAVPEGSLAAFDTLYPNPQVGRD
jgi:hypothetical protein